jgi:hypothetical protein
MLWFFYLLYFWPLNQNQNLAPLIWLSDPGSEIEENKIEFKVKTIKKCKYGTCLPNNSPCF